MQNQVRNRPVHRSPGPPIVGESPLILLVDDFEDALDIYGQYLTFRGYRVVIARNGQEAVKKAQVCRPDLILLDLRMPVMTGLDALRVMRSDPNLAGVPIVALTAHALEAERRNALEAGFDAFIAKPCLPDELVTAIQRFLPQPVLSSHSPDPECAEVTLEKPYS